MKTLMEPSAKNTLNTRDVLLGALVAMGIGLLTYALSLEDDIRKVLCGLGEMPCKMATLVLPFLGAILTGLRQFKAGEEKPAPTE